jgi:siroheme synthase-like protein
MMRLPTVLNVEGPVVVIGGGDVGLRKVEFLLKFNADVTLVDERDVAVPEGVKLVKRRLTPDNLFDTIPTDAVMVVGALSSRDLNHAIAEFCHANGILVNVVDDPDVSTILFPALSKSGDVNVAISTSGRAPFLARKIREGMDGRVEQYDLWLEVLSPVRDSLSGIDEKNRVLEKIFTDDETARLVAAGDVEGAKAKAWEVYDVHSQSKGDI